MTRKRIVIISGSVLIASLSWLGFTYTNPMEEQLARFIQEYEDMVKPLAKTMSLSYWNASISGKDEDYKRSADAEMQLSRIYMDREKFAELKKFKESKEIKDPLLARQLEILYDAYLSKQLDEGMVEQMIRISNQIEQKFSTFRARVGDKLLTDNEVEEALKTSTDNAYLEKVWNAHKMVGKEVAEEIKQLVFLRNEAARILGFPNYHEMSLRLSGQEPQKVEDLFNEVDELTRDAYKQLKSEIDDYLAKRLNIPKENLMPWHYQNRFFQEAPAIYTVDLDKYYKGKDLVTLTKNYYTSIGIDISDIIARSDLYEKPGKNQHAYCIDIDNEGDVRVLCNVKDNYNWMNTMLHEYGHGAYDKFIDRKLPYTLREPAHTFTTEAVAMIFGRMASNPKWLKDMGLISEQERAKIAESCHKTLRLEQLVFSRWAQVMYRFEKAMYENPDQDLNKLWWELVERYQMIRCPEGRDNPDWASKIHIATSPCYYHNYLLGELLASQLHYYITEKILKSQDFKNQSYYNSKAVGSFFIEKVFMPGSRYDWNTMIEMATGEKLTAKYYARQFVK